MLRCLFYFIALLVATSAIVLYITFRTLEARGAMEPIRPVHYASAVAAVALAVGGLAWLIAMKRVIARSRCLMSIIFTGLLFSFWITLTPLADKLGTAWQKPTVSPSRVWDVGYGWFYLDDSGMGNWPTTIFHHLGYSGCAPLVLLLVVLPILIAPIYPRARSPEAIANSGMKWRVRNQ